MPGQPNLEGSADLGVVIVNYQSAGLLMGCLESIAPFVDLSRVVVVDNSPVPETSRVDECYPEISTLRPQENLGFAGGCNLGIEYLLALRVSYVLLLNPDTTAPHDFAAALRRVLEREPSVAIAAPTLLSLDGRTPLFAGGRMNWWLGGPRHVRKLRLPACREWFPTPFASGCALLIRAEIFERVGLFDTAYFLYFEDADFVQRVIAAGHIAAFVPGARVVHRESSSVGRGTCKQVYYASRGRMLFLRAWSPPVPRVLYSVFTFLVKAPAVLMFLGYGRFGAFVRGAFDGLTARRL